MISFRQVLVKYAAPRLAARGYMYDDGLRDKNLIYGFRKGLGDDVWAILLFQRSQNDRRASGAYRFTVNLIRCKTTDPRDWGHGGFEGYLFTRLPQVLRFVYRLPPISGGDYQWSYAASPEELQGKIGEALDKLEAYGIPWLEDPNSKDPSEIPASKREEFDVAIRAQVVPELERMGYALHVDPAAHRAYFVKPLEGKLRAFIEFQQVYLPESGGTEFDVLLQRKETNEYFDFSRGYQLYLTLAQLLWNVFGVYPTEFAGWEHAYRDVGGQGVPVKVPPPSAYTWKYTNLPELGAQLDDALRKVKQYAVPWLEDLSSTNPQ